MIRVLIVARKGIDLYALLIKKQSDLHRGGRGHTSSQGREGARSRQVATHQVRRLDLAGKMPRRCRARRDLFARCGR